jgi:hypothetical protein
MAKKKQTRHRITRRRARVRALRAQGWSLRRIARELRVDASTVHRDLAALDRGDTGRKPPAPPPLGNQRARTHGSWSKPTQAALIARHLEAAAARWPLTAESEPHRLDLWAALSARRAAAFQWEAEHGVLAESGMIRDTSRMLPQWEARLARITLELDAREQWFGGLTRGRGEPEPDVSHLTAVERVELDALLKGCEWVPGGRPDLRLLDVVGLERVRALIAGPAARPFDGSPASNDLDVGLTSCKTARLPKCNIDQRDPASNDGDQRALPAAPEGLPFWPGERS